MVVEDNREWMLVVFHFYVVVLDEVMVVEENKDSNDQDEVLSMEN